MWHIPSALSVLVLLSAVSFAKADEARVVGGVTPSERPAGLPHIAVTGFTPFGRALLLRGISEPYPPHLGIEDQGGWYTPFSRPGMTHPYDIRGLHGARE